MESWRGGLLLQDGNSIEDIHLFSQEKETSSQFQPESTLRFLSTVEVSQVPLYLSTSPSYFVWTENYGTSAWFSDYLLAEPPATSTNSNPKHLSWFQCSNQSYSGILAEVIPASCGFADTDVTEILFYGRLNKISDENDGNAQLQVYALPISSQRLRCLPSMLSPPLSPKLDAEDEVSQFLSTEHNDALATSTEPEKKRVPDIFETASEVRRKAKGRGGAGIAAAAAGQSQINQLVGQKKPKADPALAKVNKDRNLVVDTKVDTSSQSWSPLFSNGQGKKSHTSSPNLPSEFRQHGRKLSSLSRVTSFATQDDGESSIEQQNKAMISRLVMAGMRLYGLQSRKKTERPQASPIIPDEVPSTLTSQDEEYKTVYHQTYKSTVFAFRHHMATKALHLQTDILRDAVDTLLALFCSDPVCG